jgi:hypothetical protein
MFSIDAATGVVPGLGRQSAARNIGDTLTSDPINAHGYRGLVIFLRLYALPTSGNVAVRVEEFNPGTKEWRQLHQFAAATAAGHYRYALAPGGDAASGTTAGVNAYIGAIFRVVLVFGGASGTYETAVSYRLVP